MVGGGGVKKFPKLRDVIMDDPKTLFPICLNFDPTCFAVKNLGELLVHLLSLAIRLAKTKS